VPLPIWKDTLAALAWYGTQDSEGLVYWGGAVGAASEIQVLSLLRVNHDPQGYRAKPSQTASRELLRALRSRDEKLIAQVHSHPGVAFHSPGDDQFATSFHPGFLSIVVPHFARTVALIDECAVFEYRGAFEELTPAEVHSRIHIYDPVVDLAPPQENASTNLEEKQSWKSLIRKLRSIAPKKR
jgi:hypothetical protein